jgi:hypothetical protein
MYSEMKVQRKVKIYIAGIHGGEVKEAAWALFMNIVEKEG